jgi:hypothetical protein
MHTGFIDGILLPQRTNEDTATSLCIFLGFLSLQGHARIAVVLDLLNTHMSMDVINSTADLCGRPRTDEKTLDCRHKRRAWLEDPVRRIHFQFTTRHAALAQPDRKVVLGSRSPPATPRQLRQPRRTEPSHPALHRPLQHPPRTPLSLRTPRGRIASYIRTWGDANLGFRLDGGDTGVAVAEFVSGFAQIKKLPKAGPRDVALGGPGSHSLGQGRQVLDA